MKFLKEVPEPVAQDLNSRIEALSQLALALMVVDETTAEIALKSPQGKSLEVKNSAALLRWANDMRKDILQDGGKAMIEALLARDCPLLNTHPGYIMSPLLHCEASIKAATAACVAIEATCQGIYEGTIERDDVFEGGNHDLGGRYAALVCETQGVEDSPALRAMLDVWGVMSAFPEASIERIMRKHRQ